MFKKKIGSNKSGFTLAELLIVVGIIAVLAVVSIPILRVKLESAREQTDISNLRAAKSAAVTLLIENETLDHKSLTESDYVCYYDASQGELTTTKPTSGYGQGTLVDGGCEPFDLIVNLDEDEDMQQYTCGEDVEDCYIKVTINISGRIDIEWEAVKTT